MKTTIEIWIKAKAVENGWMLYALPGSRDRAEAVVQMQRQRDLFHDYEIREVVLRAVAN